MSKKTEKAATKKNVKKTAAPIEAATETKPVKAAKPKKERPPREELVVFALRVREDERTKIHETSGPRNAAGFARRVLVAFANEDETAFRTVIKEARELRS